MWNNEWSLAAFVAVFMAMWCFQIIHVTEHCNVTDKLTKQWCMTDLGPAEKGIKA